MVAVVTVLVLVVGSLFVAALVGFWVVLSLLHCCRPQRKRIEHEDLRQHSEIPEDRNPLLRPSHQEVIDAQDELARQDEERERERIALERERANREREERERRETEERARLAEEQEKARQQRLEMQRWELEIKAKLEREEREKAERAERDRLRREEIEAQAKADRERLMQEDNDRIARERERIERERREEKERLAREKEERERAEAEAKLKEEEQQRADQEKQQQQQVQAEVEPVADEKQVRPEADPDQVEGEQPVKLRFKDDIEREQAERDSFSSVPESNEELFTAEEIQIMNTTRKYIVLAMYDWLEPKENQIAFKAGERIWVAPDGSSPTEDYWFGEKKDGTTGYFPKAYVRPLYRKFTGPPKRRISTKVLKVQNRLSQKGLGFG